MENIWSGVILTLQILDVQFFRFFWPVHLSLSDSAITCTFFTGITTQIFTDAGQYVIQFGASDPSSKIGPAQVVASNTFIT